MRQRRKSTEEGQERKEEQEDEAALNSASLVNCTTSISISLIALILAVDEGALEA